MLGHISLHIHSYHYHTEEYAYMSDITIHIVLLLRNISLIGTEISMLYMHARIATISSYATGYAVDPGLVTLE